MPEFVAGDGIHAFGGIRAFGHGFGQGEAGGIAVLHGVTHIIGEQLVEEMIFLQGDFAKYGLLLADNLVDIGHYAFLGFLSTEEIALEVGIKYGAVHLRLEGEQGWRKDGGSVHELVVIGCGEHVAAVGFAQGRSGLPAFGQGRHSEGAGDRVVVTDVHEQVGAVEIGLFAVEDGRACVHHIGVPGVGYGDAGLIGIFNAPGVVVHFGPGKGFAICAFGGKLGYGRCIILNDIAPRAPGGYLEVGPFAVRCIGG